MKLSVTFKDPDVVHDAIRDAVRREVDAMNLPEDEADALVEMRAEKVGEQMGHWIEYGEYVRIAFDTDAMTATVEPV